MAHDDHDDDAQPSYRTTAGLARELKVPVADVAAAAQRMAQAGTDPYVRTADGDIIGQALRISNGWVPNTALTHDAAAAISAGEWIAEDRRAAIRDGWDIFETSDARRRFLLSKVEDRVDAWFEEPEHVWDSDTDVWEHVVARAAQGSALHTKALDFLATHSPAERADIDRWIDATPTRRNATCFASTASPSLAALTAGGP